MLIKPGAVSQSLVVQVVDDTGVPVTGLVAATFPTLTGIRVGSAAISFPSLTDLAALNSSFSAGGVKEYSGGYYRVDPPDSLFASECRDVRVIGEATNKRVICPPIEVLPLLNPKIVPHVRICSKTTAGATLQLMAWLESDGLAVNLVSLDPTANCVVACYMHGSGVAQFEVDAVDFGNPTANSVFEAEEADPELTADRLYDLTVTIDFLGVEYTSKRTFTAIP